MASPSNIASVHKGTFHAASLHKNPVAKALNKLSDLAGRANLVVELALCHGAVIAVAYSNEQSPCHAVRANDIVIHMADRIYQELRLRHDWLESEVASFIIEASAAHRLRPEEFAPGVILSVNSSAKVLAMKLHLLGAPLPPYSTDERDAEYLLEKISITAPAQIERIYARIFPDERLSDTARRLIDRAFQSRVGLRL